MERSEGLTKRSITKKLKASNGSEVDISHKDIEREIAKFAKAGDTQSLKELFTAYTNWELREVPRSRNPLEMISQTQLRAMENFDILARKSDARAVVLDDNISSMMALTPYESVGKIQQFYRDSIDYHPKTPRITHNETSK